MSNPEASIRVKLDPANPGQFFACCGLLELADRLWRGAEGWFSTDARQFTILRRLNPSHVDGELLIAGIGACAVSSTMPEDQRARLKHLLNQKKSALLPQDIKEKEHLSELWSSERICLHEPFDLWLDWWGDSRAGGERLKTWAGKQFVIDILKGVHAPLSSNAWRNLPPEQWLMEPINDGSLPFYFDSDIGRHSSSLDVGFSLDSLGMRSRIRPLTELAAFVGLQRFRPRASADGETYAYVTWVDPMPPTLASAACSGALAQTAAVTLQFRLLYRSKYLKGFLPATPLSKETVR